jgi:phenylalanyl-tRNA synthetase beta chain
MSMVSYRFKTHKAHKIPVNVNKINKIIGINLSEEQYINYLLKLGFHINKKIIKVPSYRSDIFNENDLAEEVARSIGYDNIKKINIDIPKSKIATNQDIENKLRYFLIDQGFYEVINPPFVKIDSNKSIRIDNPLDSNKEYLRTNITNSLLDNLMFNERRQKDSIKLFEISDVYTSENDKISKTKKLAIIASGRMGHNYEDFAKKINKKNLTKIFQDALPSENFDFQELTRDSLNTKIKNEIISCEINIEDISNEILHYKQISKAPHDFFQYSPISDLPFSKRDLSFSVKDFNQSKVLVEYILGFKNNLLKEVFIFDYFHNQKHAEIKIGFRFYFQSSKSTITETQVSNVINVIIDHTKKMKGISIPGLE